MSQKKKRTNKHSITHGLSNHPLYFKWQRLRYQCTNPNIIGYEKYGGNGVAFCKEWDNDFVSFYNWAIANGWSKEKGIRLKNPTLDFSPTNCYIDDKDILRNIGNKNNNIIAAFGENKSITDWARDTRCQVTESTIRQRIEDGWSNELSITLPPKSATSHHAAGTRLYRIWNNIKSRCKYESVVNYKNYGGRGIKVCEQWLQSFENFRDWAFNNNYDDTKSIERKNVNGDYEPDNCEFIILPEQANNKTNTVWIDAFGETKNAKQWSNDPRCQVSYPTLRKRIKMGLTGEEALSAKYISIIRG